MSKFELLKETLLGNLGEQLPISLWKHHPEVDRNPEELAQAEIVFHKLIDSDILKISFFGHFPCIDFGCTAEYDGALTGSTTLTSAAINDVSDWETLEPLDVNAGELGNQIRAVKLIQEYAHGIVPTMSTVFDPAMVADKISDKNFNKYADENPEILKGALEIITDVMIDFASATIDAGADGIFLASQHSTLSSVTDKQYKEFVYPYKLKFISRLRGKAKFIILHLHAREDNEEIRFDKIAKTHKRRGFFLSDELKRRGIVGEFAGSTRVWKLNTYGMGWNKIRYLGEAFIEIAAKYALPFSNDF